MLKTKYEFWWQNPDQVEEDEWNLVEGEIKYSTYMFKGERHFEVDDITYGFVGLKPIGDELEIENFVWDNYLENYLTNLN